MSSVALFSCLGFPGWGALHLLLDEGEPRAVLGRLAPLARAQHRLPAAGLLPLLLVCLERPEALPAWQLRGLLRAMPPSLAWRYRLVFRSGSAGLLRLRLWLPPEPGGSSWNEAALWRLAPGGTAIRSVPDPGSVPWVPTCNECRVIPAVARMWRAETDSEIRWV